MVYVTLTISVISAISALCAILAFLINRKKEMQEQARWQQKIDDSIKEQSDEIRNLSKRVDSHNNYARLFAEYGEDIAYIRGYLAQKEN